MALHNIRYVCPEISTLLINCYRSHSSLFLSVERKCFHKREHPRETRLPWPCLDSQQHHLSGELQRQTQLKRGLLTTPVVVALSTVYGNGGISFATLDLNLDISRMQSRRSWLWSQTKKTRLSLCLRERVSLWMHLENAILVEPLDKLLFEEDFLREKVEDFVSRIKKLASIAKTQPKAAYAAFTFGEISRWTYSLRVSTITSDELFQPLEEAVTKHLIPALTDQHSPGMEVRSLLALPSRLGGMGIINPTEVRSKHQRASQEVCAPLVKNILDQQGDPLTCQSLQASTKARLRREKLVEETAALGLCVQKLVYFQNQQRLSRQDPDRVLQSDAKKSSVELPLVCQFFFWDFVGLEPSSRVCLITSQTRVKRVSRIHHRTIPRPQSPFSISSSIILFFVSLPFFFNTKIC